MSGFNSEPAVAQMAKETFFFDDPNTFPDAFKQKRNYE